MINYHNNRSKRYKSMNLFLVIFNAEILEIIYIEIQTMGIVVKYRDLPYYCAIPIINFFDKDKIDRLIWKHWKNKFVRKLWKKTFNIMGRYFYYNDVAKNIMSNMMSIQKRNLSPKEIINLYYVINSLIHIKCEKYHDEINLIEKNLIRASVGDMLVRCWIGSLFYERYHGPRVSFHCGMTRAARIRIYSPASNS